MVPKNGYYLTQSDFPDYGQQFTEKYAKIHPISPKGSHSSIYRNITFCVTEMCNLACTYCYECHKSNRVMCFDTAKKIVDTILSDNNQFISKNDTQAVILDFIGGEPLLEIDLIDKIVDYFKAKAFMLNHPWAYYYMVSISTNGVLFNTPKVQEFIQKNRSHLSISISLDGNKKLHDSCRVFHDGSGSYDIVEKSVRNLLKIYPNASTKVTLAPENIMYLVDAMKNLYSLGYHCVMANGVFENVWSEKDPEILYNQLIDLSDWVIDNDIYKDMYISLFREAWVKIPSSSQYDETKKNAYCGGNGRMLAFDTEGKCYPCLRYMKHSLTQQREKPIGNINLGLYTDVKTTDWYNKLRQVTTYSSADNECRSCPALPLCPTCIAWQYDSTGDPNKKTKYHCGIFKAQLAANYYYWKKLYHKLGLNDDKFERIIPRQEYERI